MDAAAELGRNPVSKHQIQPEYGDEQGIEGRDCRTRLARPNSQAQMGTGRYPLPQPSKLTGVSLDVGKGHYFYRIGLGRCPSL